MNLSLRLESVKNMVNPCEVAADIGCDHGYVSMALINEGKAKRVIACDVNKGPLEAASLNIRASHMEGQIETRLADGLHKLSKEDAVNTIIIAGMGGRLMERILSEGLEIVKDVTQLVLQPQSELFLVRKWLRLNGFIINDEKALIDDGKHYFIISAVKGETELTSEHLQDIYDEFSKLLINRNDVILRSYLEMLLENNTGYLEKIEGEKRAGLESRNLLIEEVISLMDSSERR